MKIKGILSMLRQGFGSYEPDPSQRRSRGDVLLLRWVLLSIGVLAALVGLQACRLFAPMHDWQLILLAGDPFYLTAQDAQVTLLSAGEMFALCVVITLYLGAALLRQKRLARRSHLCLLAAVAISLPGLMCVLWHGVLYVAQPLACVILLWLALVPCAFARRLFD